jgi:peptidyl-prolyl cis-trans isomerase C
MRRALLAAVLFATLVASTRTRADDAGTAGVASTDPAAEKARRAAIVARIGERTITAGELEDRLAALPPFQRATFGADAAAVRRAFLQQVLVPEGLYALGAAEQKLDQTPPMSFEVERAVSNATLRAIRQKLGPESAIAQADVQAYYDANRDRYDTPERYQIWRILCKTEDEAKDVLAQASKSLDIKTFGDLARDHSLDKSSNLRAGNLGFLSADGVSNEPGLKVDPAVVKAAQSVRDGQLVPAPVPEGDAFAVVWRHGTIPATKRSVDDVAAQIRDTLWKGRVKTETDKLVASLRASKLRDFNDGPLFDLPTTLGADAGGLLVQHSAREGGSP